MMRVEEEASRKRCPWLFVIAVLLPVLAGSVGLTCVWFRRERMSLRWAGAWGRGCPVLENLAQYVHLDWGGTFAITENLEPDQPDIVAVTYQQWWVGPFMVRKRIYLNTKSHLMTHSDD